MLFLNNSCFSQAQKMNQGYKIINRLFGINKQIFLKDVCSTVPGRNLMNRKKNGKTPHYSFHNTSFHKRTCFNREFSEILLLLQEIADVLILLPG